VPIALIETIEVVRAADIAIKSGIRTQERSLREVPRAFADIAIKVARFAQIPIEVARFAQISIKCDIRTQERAIGIVRLAIAGDREFLGTSPTLERDSIAR
jgi:hypothetical protein